MSTPRTHRNSINRPDFFRVCTWMTANKDVIEKQRTYAAVGKMAYAALEISLATSAVKQAMEATGLNLLIPVAPVVPATATEVLARELVRVLNSLGEVATPELLALCGKAETPPAID